MIHWKPPHSAAITAVAFALSVVLYYVALVIPLAVPLWLAMILFFIPAVLLAAMIDHGHGRSPWSVRSRRLLISWVAVFGWMVVASTVPAFMTGNMELEKLSAGNVGSYVSSLLLMAAVVAALGILVVRWIERGTTTLMVIDQPKKN